MSHTTTIKSVPIKDVSAMRQAVQRLNNMGVKAELRENAVPRMFYRDQLTRGGRATEECPYVIHLPDSRYDVGFVEAEKPEDGYEAVFDSWAGEIAKQIGAPYQQSQDSKAATIGKFLQQYTACASINAAVNAGYQVMSEFMDTSTGELHLKLNV